MTEEKKKLDCQHINIHYDVISHDGITHPTGLPRCSDCRLTIPEIITQEKRELLEGLRMEKKIDERKIWGKEEAELARKIWGKASTANMLVDIKSGYNQAVQDNNQSIDKELEKLK